MGNRFRDNQRPASARASRAVAAAIEPLSRRVLLSANLSSAGILKIIGSDAADAIVVSGDATFINVLDVNVNGQTKYFSIADIVRIDVRAKGGDDTVRIDASLDALHLRALIDAGAGDDRVTTGAGNDTVIGGEGDDRLYGMAGNDKLHGQGGRDSLYGGDGNDTLNGGTSNDVLYAAAGDDRVEGNKGNDRLDGGDGNDSLSDKVGRDVVYAGAGNDTGTFKDGGKIYAGPGDDTFTSGGGAELNGEAGNDRLTGIVVSGGGGNDTINGTSRADALHGGDGDDVVYGRAGQDELFGDAGADALYGGAGSDELHGGAGDDNLYGDDGADTRAVAEALDNAGKHRLSYDAGHDVGFGDADSDWFEPTHRWLKIDGNKKDSEASKDQNQITIDPSRGRYGSSYYTGIISRSSSSSGGSLTISAGFSSGTWNGTSTISTNATVGLGTTIDLSAHLLKSLGSAGWLASGNFDQAQLKFSPVALDADQRKQVGRVVLQLPGGWSLNEMTSARDDIVWYRVSTTPTVTLADPAAKISVRLDGPTLVMPSGQTAALNVSSLPYVSHITPGSTLTFGGITVQNGTITINDTTPPLTPAMDSNIIELPANTPGLIDGVQGNQYRFLAVKRGTVLVSTAAGGAVSASLFDPKSFAWQSGLVALPDNGEVRLAGSTVVYHVGRAFSTVPTGAPTGARGILLAEGAIWLPLDGTAPSFSANP